LITLTPGGKSHSAWSMSSQSIVNAKLCVTKSYTNIIAK